MTPDELKEAWRAQASPHRLAIDATQLLIEVRRNQRHFTSVLFWRDVREVGVSLLLVPLWIFLGGRSPTHWTWYLAIPTFLWVAGFMMVDRVRQNRRQPKPGDTLRECIESSLAQVNHQIWLLRNVFWWYLLPPSAAVAVFLGQCAWQVRAGGWPALFILGGVVAVAALIDWGVYLLNQRAVKKELEPRRQELEALLQGLQSNDA
ncbi:hypothetical protein HQ590_04050 [bacterium]|nr:hypothetical protein [bacterium]